MTLNFRIHILRAMNKHLSNQMNPFEQIKQTNEYGADFWSARDLQVVLEYSTWQKFTSVIEKAIISCKNSQVNPEDHFNQTVKMVTIGSDTQRPIDDYNLSRYACYLIIQNADPSKAIIAHGQTYFAIQTRKQELAEETPSLSEDELRLKLRKEMKAHNKQLAAAANQAGVIEPRDYAIFQNHGYKGLYGGMDKNAIHKKKGLKKSQDILDHMGSTELAANLFRATQTQEKLQRENIKGKMQANKTHFEVGQKIRQTIQELGGTMPEDLPTPSESIKQLENKAKKLENKKE